MEGETEEERLLYRLLAACIVYVPGFHLDDVAAEPPSYFDDTKLDVYVEVLKARQGLRNLEETKETESGGESDVVVLPTVTGLLDETVSSVASLVKESVPVPDIPIFKDLFEKREPDTPPQSTVATTEQFDYKQKIDQLTTQNLRLQNALEKMSSTVADLNEKNTVLMAKERAFKKENKDQKGATTACETDLKTCETSLETCKAETREIDAIVGIVAESLDLEKEKFLSIVSVIDEDYEIPNFATNDKYAQLSPPELNILELEHMYVHVVKLYGEAIEKPFIEPGKDMIEFSEEESEE